MSERAERYTAVAIVLHWAIAAAILYMLPLGFWMHMQAEDGNASEGVFRAFQLHKSVGFTILVLSLVRLGWRFANPPPPLPEHMPGWEKFAAKATHWAFYAIMIGMPLSGWVFVSAGWSLHEDRSLAVPTYFFGLFQVPALFNLPQASNDVRESVADVAFDVHVFLAFTAIGLFVLHVSAALKHHAFDKDAVLAHMVPGVRAPFETGPAPKNPTRLAILGGGLALITAALIALLAAAASFDTAAPPPQTTSTFEAPATTEVAPAAPTAEQAVPAAPGQAAAPTPAPAGAPARWQVDTARSSIGFSYVYSDDSGETPFNGRFARWRADIRFDPNNLDASSANVTIETASASTGAAMHDSTLQTAPWFNSGANPTATFRASEIRRRDGGYEARGTLTLRGASRDVRLPFTLAIEGDRATMNGRVTIDRRDFDIGEDADGDDLISRDVTVTVHLEAVRAP